MRKKDAGGEDLLSSGGPPRRHPRRDVLRFQDLLGIQRYGRKLQSFILAEFCQHGQRDMLAKFHEFRPLFRREAFQPLCHKRTPFSPVRPTDRRRRENRSFNPAGPPPWHIRKSGRAASLRSGFRRDRARTPICRRPGAYRSRCRIPHRFAASVPRARPHPPRPGRSA